MTRVRLLHSQKVYSGEISIRMDKFTLQGKNIQKEIVEHSPSVGLIPILDNSNIILITQYRHAAGKNLLEIPAGKIEDGETKEQAAKREMNEETGYKGKFHFLANWFLAPGYNTELIYIFMVTNLKKINDKYGNDDDENIKLKKLSLRTALKKCTNGKIIDGKTIAALFLYQQYLALSKNSKI